MNKSFTVKNFILLFFLFMATINIIIFILRVIYPETWWIRDQIFYKNVDFLLHLESLVVFLFYLFVIMFFSLLLLNNSKVYYIKKINLPFYFISILFLYVIYSFVSFQYGVAVAGSVENTAGSWQILFYLISIDGIFYAYALHEKDSKRLFLVTIMYSISNIFRGWAGFIIYIILIYLIRNRTRINYFKILVTIIVSLPILTLLLYLREIFRGGTELIELYNLQGYSGVEFCIELFINLIQNILVRFDLYSNYIGINSLINLEDMCYPFQENFYYRILLRTGIVENCTSLGSILPSHLSSWFYGRGTSFTISAAFFALPFDKASVYFISNILILIICLIIIRFFFYQLDIVLFTVSMVFLLFLQGWTYQYIYIYFGFIIGLSFIKFSRIK